jgi:hypothetical protein
VSAFSDDELTRLLRDSLDEEPSATGLARAFAAADLAGRGDQLAAVDYDSLEDGLLMRSDEQADRAVSLTMGELTVEFEVIEEDARLVGQVIPPAPAVVSVVQFGSGQEVTADDSGRFATPLGQGPLQVVVECGDARLISPWITR